MDGVLTANSTTTTIDCQNPDTDTTRNEAQSINGCPPNTLMMTDQKQERIAVLDCGAQYGKVIDRRIREKRVASDILPLHTKADDIVKNGLYRGIVISGGPSSVYLDSAPTFDKEIFHCGLPVLGICYGFQLLNRAMGGDVRVDKLREDGETEIWIDPASGLFKGMASHQLVLLTHGDSVTAESVAPSLKITARSGDSLVAGISDESRHLYGVQFHPEVNMTENGGAILENFLYGICGCQGRFTMASRQETCIKEIRDTVGNNHVLVMVSGGVDSTVCAALMHKALGADKVTAIHVDNGFMRYKESERVERSLKSLKPPLDLHVYDRHFLFKHAKVRLPSSATAEKIEREKEEGRWTQELCRTVEPEAKRRIIGDTFMQAKDDAVAELGLNPGRVYLAQGTLRPDLIESASTLASSHADAIKTHHNDTDLVRQLRDLGKVIEPLKDFHKDEVRALGRTLCLPEYIVQRHPFPGPGLAIRIICALQPFMCVNFKSTQQKLTAIVGYGQTVEKKIDARIYVESCLSEQDLQFLNAKVASIPLTATLLPIKTVGVQGDKRSYSYVAALSCDAPPQWPILDRIAKIIPRILHNINRVVFVFGPSIQGQICDVTPTLLTDFSVNQAKLADKAANEVLFSRGSGPKSPSNTIQQMPVVLLPIHFDRNNDDQTSPSVKRSICLRPFITNDFMTGKAALPSLHIDENIVDEMVQRVLTETPLISRVMIDLTSKPPGTTEWE